MAGARTYFKRFKPLENFADVSADVHVRAIRSKSHLLHVGAFDRKYKDIEALFNACGRISTNIDMGRIARLYANQYSKAFQDISLKNYVLAATEPTYRFPLWMILSCFGLLLKTKLFATVRSEQLLARLQDVVFALDEMARRKIIDKAW